MKEFFKHPVTIVLAGASLISFSIAWTTVVPVPIAAMLIIVGIVRALMLWGC